MRTQLTNDGLRRAVDNARISNIQDIAGTVRMMKERGHYNPSNIYSWIGACTRNHRRW